MNERITTTDIMDAAEDLAEFVRTQMRNDQNPELELAPYEDGTLNLTEFELELYNAHNELSIDPHTLIRMERMVPGARYTSLPNSDRTVYRHSIVFPVVFAPGSLPLRYTAPARPRRARAPSLMRAVGLMTAGAGLVWGAVISLTA